MCGIAGILSLDGPLGPATGDRLHAASVALRHRGPDDEGYFRDNSLGFAFRRLSIIDLAGGHQPMTNEDGTIWIIFNGEIYNYQELAAGLRQRGHVFRTRCDTEVMVHLYEDRGVDFVQDLRGMFSVALWDAKRKRLLLVRDRLGIKPLFYRDDGRELIFGSEIKAILAAIPSSARRMEPSSLARYLTFLYLPGDRCFFEGIRKLPPGHLLKHEDGKTEVRRYWKLPVGNSRRPASRSEAVRDLGDLLKDSVRMRLLSDVPLGAFLSGGIDSSTVVALMQDIVQEPVKTFTIGFEEKGFNEIPFANKVASQLGTDHHNLVVREDAVDLLEKIVSSFDEPFGDSSAIPTYLVSQLAREYVTVALSGDGGDELFAGYKRYRSLERLEQVRRVPARLRKLAVQMLQAANLRGFQATRARGFLKRSLSHFPADYLELVNHLVDPRVRAAIEPEWLLEASHVGWESDPGESSDPVDGAQRIDLLHYLPEDILAKVDRMSMACSLEARVPLLDHHVVEYVTSLPRTWKGDEEKPKSLLLEASGIELPPEVWNRPKQGFGIPLKAWFRNELKDYVRDLLLDETARQRGFWRAKGMEALIASHQAGDWDFSGQLWAFLTFEVWHRRYLDDSALEAPPGGANLDELKLPMRTGLEKRRR